MNNQIEKSKNQVPEYSIGVVTYVARFEEFFVPLIKQLVEVFPDREIVCIINGHYDKTLQINYLKKVTAFLSRFSNVRYITNEVNQPLSKCFNWLLMMSYAPKMLILNDDISLNLLFRLDFEKRLLDSNNDLFVINHSWSHFLISKQFVKEIGWFEERLPATGYEDGDYQIRIRDKGKQVARVTCHGIINYIAPQTNAGWADISLMMQGGKSSAVNSEFLAKKYECNEIDGKECLRPGMETPMFYDFSCLDNQTNDTGENELILGTKKISMFLFLKLPFYAAYSYVRKTGGKIYRAIRKALHI